MALCQHGLIDGNIHSGMYVSKGLSPSSRLRLKIRFFYIDASNAYLAHYHTRCEADHEINTFMNGAKSSLQNGHTHPASDDEAAPLLGRDGCITGEVLTLKRRERTLGVLVRSLLIPLYLYSNEESHSSLSFGAC